MMAKEAAGSLIIRLLGPFDVQVQGRPLPRLRSKKGPWLLTLLVLRGGQPVAREWLAETLWPDSLTDEALRNLRQSLTDLRKALGEESSRISSPTPRTLMLDLNGADVDVLRFDAAMRRQDTAGLEQSVALYRGQLLEGCSEEWILPEREARQQAYHQALQQLAAYSMAGGDTARAVGYLRQAVAIEPSWEEAARSLMQALTQGGDVNAALQVYQELAHRLRDSDPQALPDAQTNALYQNLRAQARQRASATTTVSPLVPPSSYPPGFLPRPLTELVGREEQVKHVRAQLRLSRLVTLTGTGGVGKTRLAIAAAEGVVDEYPDGVWFVELAALSEASLVVQAAASVLEVREQSGRTLLQTLASYLKPKSLLLVLDNCEHLLAACAQVSEELLRTCVGLRVMATSREALGVSGESVYRVPSLSIADVRHLSTDKAAVLEMVSRLEAVQLFVERVEAVQKTFELTGENARRVAQICQRLEGIPLAIELAAARVRALTLDQIAGRLDDRFGLLKGGSRTALPRQQTLRATLDWSYDLLSEPERLLLRRLSVFAKGWTLEAAEAVCAGFGEGVGGRVWVVVSEQEGNEEFSLHPISDTLHPTEVLDLLSSLVDKSLIVFEEREAEGRYHLLETIRQYAQEKLKESGEEALIRGRHLAFFLALAETAEPQLTGSGQRIWLERLEAEHDNLRAALEWCLEKPGVGYRVSGVVSEDERERGREGEGEENQGTGDREQGTVNPNTDTRYPSVRHPTPDTRHPSEAGLRLAGALGWFWNLHGYLSVGRAYLAEALGREGAAGRTPERAKALSGAGVLARNQGDYGAARELLDQSLAIYRDLGNKEGMAFSLMNLGNVAHYQGDYEATTVLYQQSLVIQQELGNQGGIVSALDSPESVARNPEDLWGAKILYEQSLVIARELGDQWGITFSLICLGSVAREQGDYEAARRLLEESLAIARELGDQWGIAWSLHQQGIVAHDQGDYATARTLHEQSLAIRQELEDRRGITYSLHNLGIVARNQGDYAAARSLHEQSLAILREMGDRHGIAHSLHSLGVVAINQRDYRASRALQEESLAIYREMADKPGIAFSLEAFALLAMGEELLEHAVRLWGAAEALRKAIGAPLPPNDREAYARSLSAAQEALGEEAFAAAWADGWAMSMEQAIEFALQGNTASSG